MILFNGTGVYETSAVENFSQDITVKVDGLDIVVSHYDTKGRAQDVLRELVGFLDMDIKERAAAFGTTNVYKLPVR